MSIPSIVSYSPSRNLSDKTKCSKEQIARQRYITPAIIESFPLKPYCTNNLKHGLVIRPRSQALRKPYIEVNPPALVRWLVFDIDRDNGAFAWEDDPGVKPPHLSIVNQETGRAHLWYELLAPVCRSEAGHLKPLEYLAAIQRTYTHLLGADPGYAGLVTKNPLHPSHGLIVFRPLSKPYSLSDLAANVDLLPKPRKPEVVQGFGRNVSCFDTVREWAYKAISGYWRPNGLTTWKEAVRAQAEAVNHTFPQPLPISEIRSIAESIAKWTWKRITPGNREQKEYIARTHTPEMQSERGKRSGEVRRQNSEDRRASARLMRSAGKTIREIAETLAVPRSTVGEWVH